MQNICYTFLSKNALRLAKIRISCFSCSSFLPNSSIESIFIYAPDNSLSNFFISFLVLRRVCCVSFRRFSKSYECLQQIELCIAFLIILLGSDIEFLLLCCEYINIVISFIYNVFFNVGGLEQKAGI